MSVTFPPASSTIRAPAAMSQGLRLNCQYDSSFPQATLANPTDAAPIIRIPRLAGIIVFKYLQFGSRDALTNPEANTESFTFAVFET